MTVQQQQIEDAASDFEGMISDGSEIEDALDEAARSNGISRAVLENRLSRAGSLEALAEGIRRRASANQFQARLANEVDKCRRRVPPYSGINLFDTEEETRTVASQIELALQRSLSSHESDSITDALHPYLTDLRLKMKYGLQPLHGSPFRKS